MFEYILRLFILVPMIGGLAWGSLWLWRKAQMGLPMQGGNVRAAQMVDVVPLGPGSKLAVVAFGGREAAMAVDPESEFGRCVEVFGFQRAGAAFLIATTFDQALQNSGLGVVRELARLERPFRFA